MSRAIALLASVLILCATAHAQGNSGPALTLSQAIEAMRPSVVQVQLFVQPGLNNQSLPREIPQIFVLGSGVVVSEKGYVVTARHVVHDIQSLPIDGAKLLRVGIAFPNLDKFKSGTSTISIRSGFASVDVEIVEEDERHDLALLKFKHNPFDDQISAPIRTPKEGIGYLKKAVALASGARPVDGEKAIAISGYPLNENVLISTSGAIASAWAFKPTSVRLPGSHGERNIPAVDDVYIGDIHVNPGNSGGPVYFIHTAELLGICIAYQNAPLLYGDGQQEQATIGGRSLVTNSGLSQIVPVQYVRELLNRNGL